MAQKCCGRRPVAILLRAFLSTALVFGAATALSRVAWADEDAQDVVTSNSVAAQGDAKAEEPSPEASAAPTKKPGEVLEAKDGSTQVYQASAEVSEATAAPAAPEPATGAPAFPVTAQESAASRVVPADAGHLPASATPTTAAPKIAVQSDSDVDQIIVHMTIDEKIAQMIIPAIRTWNGQEVVDLSAVPELAAALRKHQYGGIILFGQNVKGVEQTFRLVYDLQANNGQIGATSKIPYLMPIDEEGGVVTRLSMGTRMTGSMATGATGEQAEANAEKTGEVIGKELAALGFNVDFAPDADVNNNPLNPVIGVRSFSDDPKTVAKLAMAFMRGLKKSNVAATFKHFPGHGDTATDTHTGGASVNKTGDELRKTELVPFKFVVEGGADIIMTAHITLPKFDDPVIFADGTTGYYPATMSHKILTDLLRRELGYDGVIVTDALEMGAVYDGGLVPGRKGSVEYCTNVAEKVINAGADMLLIPTDLKSEEAAAFYDQYIAALIAKVNDGSIPVDRINESVRRILELKKKYGILDLDVSAINLDQAVANAKQVVGSDENHAAEMDVAQQVVTVIKNDSITLPVSGHKGAVVVLGRQQGDEVVLDHAIKDLQEKGIIAADAKVTNLVSGATRGSDSSAMKIVIALYYDELTGTALYSQDLIDALAHADVTIALSKMYNVSGLQDDSPYHQGIQKAIDQTHAVGGKFVLLSANLPYDVARYQNADAIVLAYMASGTNMDPTDRGSGNAGAYNANIIAAVEAMFDARNPTGELPVNIPSMTKKDDGSYTFDPSPTLYKRGFGLSYDYQFTNGGNATYVAGSERGLVFETNARHDKLVKVLVDGVAVSEGDYEVLPGSTVLALSSRFLDALSAGKHVLALAYDYGEGEFDLSTAFAVAKAAQNASEASDDSSSIYAATSAPSHQARSKAAYAGLPKTGDLAVDVAPLILVAAGLLTAGGAMMKGVRVK